jgi:hypothetical protein
MWARGAGSGGFTVIVTVRSGCGAGTGGFTMPIMNAAGRQDMVPDDAAQGKRAAVEYLVGLNPDLDLAADFWRGKLRIDRWGQLIPGSEQPAPGSPGRAAAGELSSAG